MVEATVASVLVLLVTGIAYATLLLVHRSWFGATARASLAVNCEVALERVRRDLQDGNRDSLTFRQGPAAVSVMTARDASGSFRTEISGHPDWQGHVMYYIDSASGVLRRRTVPITSAVALTSDQLLALADGSGSLVAHDVSDLTLLQSADDVRLTVTCSSSTDAAASITMTGSFLMRN